jgi:hypothetical protein
MKDASPTELAVAAVRATLAEKVEPVRLLDATIPLRYTPSRTTVLILAWREEVIAQWDNWAKMMDQRAVALAKSMARRYHGDRDNLIVCGDSRPACVMTLPHEDADGWSKRPVVVPDQSMVDARPAWVVYFRQAQWMIEQVDNLSIQDSTEVE